MFWDISADHFRDTLLSTYFEILSAYFQNYDVRIRHFDVRPKMPKTCVIRRRAYHEWLSELTAHQNHLIEQLN